MVYLKDCEKAKTSFADWMYSVATVAWVALVFSLRVTQGVVVAVNLVLIRVPKHLIMGMHLVVGVAVAVSSQVKLNTLFLLSSVRVCSREQLLTSAATGKTRTNGIRGTRRAMEWCGAVSQRSQRNTLTFEDNICGILCCFCKWLSSTFLGQVTSKNSCDTCVVRPLHLAAAARARKVWEESRVVTSVYMDKKFPGGEALVVVVHENEGYFGWFGNFWNRERGYTSRKFKGEDGETGRLVDVGMYKSAQEVCKHVASYVDKNDPKQERIVVTGYSLGGGVAVYATGLLQNRFPKKSVSGFAFGSPCVLTKQDIATTPIENLECYMFSQDIIPRLSQNWVMHTLVLCYEFGRRLFGCASMQYKWNDWEDMAVPNPTTLFADRAVPLPSPPFNPFREALLECGADHSIDKYVRAIQSMADQSE